MTIKGTQVIGLKIISLQDGKEIGKAQDLIYDPDEKKIMAIIVKKGGLFSDPKLILINDIKNIGNDALIIDNQTVIKSSSEAGEKISAIAKNDTYITRTRIMSDHGVELGTVSDLLFDPTTGNVEKLEVSQGGLKDFRSGKKYIDVSQIETIGKDVIIVKSEAEKTVKQQEEQQDIKTVTQKNLQDISKNLKDTAQDTQDQIQPSFEEVKNQTKDIGKNIKDKVSDFVETAQTKISGAQDNIEEKRIHEVIGRYLTINILTPNDEIVARRGDMITNKLIQTAENYGLLSQVLNNNSDKPIEDPQINTL